MLKHTLIIHEKTNRVEIPQNKMTGVTEIFSTDYSLKTNCFDPTKGSPPNDFMKKLHMRMSIYDYYASTDATGVNADKCDKE